MNKTNFKRFGDTAFRLKNQVKFYSEILIFIYNSINQSTDINYLTIDEIWDYVNSNIVEYKEKSVSHKWMLLRQLEKFDLILRDKDKIKKTATGEAFLSFLNEEYNYDILSVLFFYIMINTGELSKIFRSFASEIINMESEITRNFIINFIISNDTYESDKNIESIYEKISNEQVQKVLEFSCIQEVFKCRKPLTIDKSLPALIKTLNNSQDENTFYKVIDNDDKLKQHLKKMYQFSIGVTKRKIIKDNDLIKYVFLRGNNLIYDAINTATYNTVNKDYFDINVRWFTGCNLLTNVKNKYYVNKNYKNLYKDLLNIKFDPHLENLKLFLNNANIKVNANQLPYNKDETIKMLKMCSNKQWTELKKVYELDGISNATIFEYLVNLSFFISREDSVENFRKYCYTLLDDDLKPKSHAPAGNPDGIYEKNNFYSTIEATIIPNLENMIKNEYTSIQRHSYKKYEDIITNTEYYSSKNNKYPSIIFIILSDLNQEILNNFSSKEKSSYFADSNIELRTLTLSNKHIISLFEKDKLSEIYRIFSDLPLMKNTKVDDYEEIINKII